MRILIGCLALCLFLNGCVLQQPYARINDVNLGEADPGFLLVSIDGKPVQRAGGHVSTVSPMAIVPSGRHTLELQNKRNPQAPSTKISVELKPETEYRFVAKGDSVELVATYSGADIAPKSQWEGQKLFEQILGL